uniref:Uncharacterized protein n=1 Tax=Anguilla anguilla TaxID=7936 RepID=A0A0E9TQS5_ANGAN
MFFLARLSNSTYLKQALKSLEKERIHYAAPNEH